MTSDAVCPICSLDDLLRHDNGNVECATCGHEWALSDDELEVRDSNGVLLANGDTIVLIKGVPLNGKANAFKAGTKVKGIRLVAGDHEIDCKIEGRSILLKAELVRRA